MTSFAGYWPTRGRPHCLALAERFLQSLAGRAVGRVTGPVCRSSRRYRSQPLFSIMMEEARSLNTFFRPITDKGGSANFASTRNGAGRRTRRGPKQKPRPSLSPSFSKGLVLGVGPDLAVDLPDEGFAVLVVLLELAPTLTPPRSLPSSSCPRARGCGSGRRSGPGIRRSGSGSPRRRRCPGSRCPSTRGCKGRGRHRLRP